MIRDWPPTVHVVLRCTPDGRTTHGDSVLWKWRAPRQCDQYCPLLPQTMETVPFCLNAPAGPVCTNRSWGRPTARQSASIPIGWGRSMQRGSRSDTPLVVSALRYQLLCQVMALIMGPLLRTDHHTRRSSLRHWHITQHLVGPLARTGGWVHTSAQLPIDPITHDQVPPGRPASLSVPLGWSRQGGQARIRSYSSRVVWLGSTPSSSANAATQRAYCRNASTRSPTAR